MKENTTYNLKLFIGQTSLDFSVGSTTVNKFISALKSDNKKDWFSVEHIGAKKTEVKLSSVVAYEVNEPKFVSIDKKSGLVPFTALAKFFDVHPIRITRNCKKIVSRKAGERIHSRASLDTALEFREYLIRSGENKVPTEAEIKSFFGKVKK